MIEEEEGLGALWTCSSCGALKLAFAPDDFVGDPTNAPLPPGCWLTCPCCGKEPMDSLPRLSGIRENARPSWTSLKWKWWSGASQ